jgi:MucR family transcriptional regulator, transcriptional regulator of exopolysaccharide biosynthesis
MDKDTVAKLDPRFAARIVRGYAGRHGVSVGELQGLITTVQQSLGRLGQSAPVAEALVPAVPIKRSVHRDYVVCLECGFRSRMLRRHPRTGHQLAVAEYRARWKLSPDHVLIAPGYSAYRSAMAKEIGLGRKSSRVEASPLTPEAVPLPAPKRRGSKSWSAAA